MERTLDLVAEQGPIRARDTGAVRPPPRAGHMWNWHEGKVALEYLFFTGQVGAARRVNFERLDDTIDRICRRKSGAPTPSAAEAQRQLVGSPPGRSVWPPSPTSATTSGLRSASKARVAELAPPVSCSGRGLRVVGARLSVAGRPAAARINARALLSPFDSLVWFRQRTERLFGFRYRIEISTPARQAHPRLYVFRSCSATPGRPRRSQVRSPDGRPGGPGRVRGARHRHESMSPPSWRPSCASPPAGWGLDSDLGGRAR